MSKFHASLQRNRWQASRRVVFKRDSYRCQNCGRAGRLECDHVVRLEDEPQQDPYDPEGCQTLCRDCHISKTARENRIPLTPEQYAWREYIEAFLSRTAP